jgi:sugar phosphate isomerase/epimerase
VLGNPVTGGEKDLAALCDRLAQWGYHALELIPPRNTDDRVAAVIAEAGKRGWPVFDGSEHNTPAMEPLRSKWGMDERFRPYFHDSALVLLGHQALVKSGRPGYLDREGRPVPGGFAACQVAGRKVFEQTTRH